MAEAFQIPPFQPEAFQGEALAGSEDQQPTMPLQVASVVFARSALNKLSPAIRRKISFYAPLTDHLLYIGISGATFVRASSTTSLWRNGQAMPIGANVPRYHYANADTSHGILINPSTETLTFPATNNLHDGGYLFWVQNGVVMRAPSSSNPINSGGVVTGSERAIRDLLKFPLGVTLTTQEITEITAALTL